MNTSNSPKPKILITNDDGIYAPGIQHLWNALKGLADVTVVAPRSEQSAKGLSISLLSPLQIEAVEWQNGIKVWSVNDGTPADCVKLALHAVLDEQPDLLISGINRGINDGRNVLYSGTIAAVIEGIFHDVPGIAISCADWHNPSFAVAEKHIPSIVQYVLDHPLPMGSFLNVNFPDCKQGPIKGFKYARQGKRLLSEQPEKRLHPNTGAHYYWLGTKWACFEDEHEESDVTWLDKGYATAVPIKITELTDHQIYREKKEHFESYFAR